jgi:alkylation response protein AidB-like acyl-CoA dehydrogenase
MQASTSDLLDALLAAVPPTAANLRAWFEVTSAARRARAHTIERALVGGALADRLGFAFAAGYSEALRFLVPHLDGITALCATEADGNHPRAIRTRLAPAGVDRYTLTGHKKWATVANEASALLVVASTGDDPATGRNRLRVVRVPTSAPNLRIRSSAAPFVPEIEHAEVELAGVEVSAADLLPGDGYDDYLKPFRTVEDLHVHAALIGYLIGVARRRAFAPSLVEALLALAATTRALADADVKAASTHLALAGLIDLSTRLVADLEGAWSLSPTDDEWQRWQRDRPLLHVATKARLARRETARTALLGPR